MLRFIMSSSQCNVAAITRIWCKTMQSIGGSGCSIDSNEITKRNNVHFQPGIIYEADAIRPSSVAISNDGFQRTSFVSLSL